LAQVHNDFHLEKYLADGIRDTLKSLLGISRGNPRSALFFARFARNLQKSQQLRLQSEGAGLHVPPFLIASITQQCNLNCAGCYAMALAGDESGCASPGASMDAAQWDGIFSEAEALGIGFVLLAGGEPLLKPEILAAAGRHAGILFPVFTNGTLLSGDALKLFRRHRNLVPVISLEGGMESTDLRRGPGVFSSIFETMKALKKTGILFGASVTVTTDNLEEVLGQAFRETLSSRGCRAIIYVEYVPMGATDQALAPGAMDRARMMDLLNQARQGAELMLLIAFPGDEEASGGCLAAGRGFIHIQHDGSTEPCPFSPFSDTNVTSGGIRGALDSPFFRRLRESGILTGDHAGGCVLHQRRAEVEAMAAQR
jgi:MoaA/NifB/PqqE/SkfB family radical SAM enzyme